MADDVAVGAETEQQRSGQHAAVLVSDLGDGETSGVAGGARPERVVRFLQHQAILLNGRLSTGAAHFAVDGEAVSRALWIPGGGIGERHSARQYPDPGEGTGRGQGRTAKPCTSTSASASQSRETPMPAMAG